MSPLTAPLLPLRRAAAGVRWWAREMSGEGAWDRYLADCARAGVAPADRRTFERARDHHREHSTQGRCC